MRKVIDIQNWKRKEEYLFFRTFFSPAISVTVEVDCTIACRRAKELGIPLSLYYMHAAIVAANRIEELRYRQEGDEVVLYDRVDLFTPILTADGSYRSVRLPATENLNAFVESARPLVEAAKRGEGEAHSEVRHGKDILLISVNPWYHFTGVQLSIPCDPHQNIPIFTFGKIGERDGRRTMPVAMTVNHGFVSGYQIGKYLKEFQKLLDREEGEGNEDFYFI